MEELLRNHVPILVIDNSAERAQWAIDREIPTLIADATQDDTLREARLDQARGLVAAISSDAKDLKRMLPSGDMGSQYERDFKMLPLARVCVYHARMPLLMALPE